MTEKINFELELLRKRYPDLQLVEDGCWIKIPSYPLPEGWNFSHTDVVFQIPISYPGTQPYGFYTQVGITYNNQKPDNYVDPAKNQPPFDGTWGIFSWSPSDNQWRPKENVIAGTNLVNWVMGFKVRFEEGK